MIDVVLHNPPNGTLENPCTGDIRLGTELGFTRNRKYVWYPCEDCQKERWVILTNKNPRTKYCVICRYNHMSTKHHAKEYPAPEGTLDNPIVGDIVRGNDLGYINNQAYEYKICTECNKGYWHRINDIKITNMCRKCYDKNHATKDNNYKWKGGHITKQGYRVVCIGKDSPYWDMGQKHNGYIKTIIEHRLVMAIHLGRCLKPWEEVHHLGTKYPKGSIEDKQDNRIENLKLVSGASHQGFTTLENRVRHLEDKVDTLEERLKNTEQLIKFFMWERKKSGVG